MRTRRFRPFDRQPKLLAVPTESPKPESLAVISKGDTVLVTQAGVVTDVDADGFYWVVIAHQAMRLTRSEIKLVREKCCNCDKPVISTRAGGPDFCQRCGKVMN